MSFIDLFQNRTAEDLYDDVGAEEINLDDDAYDEANTISKWEVNWRFGVKNNPQFQMVRFSMYIRVILVSKSKSLSHTFKQFKTGLEREERNNFNDQRHFTDIKLIRFQIQVVMKD